MYIRVKTPRKEGAHPPPSLRKKNRLCRFNDVQSLAKSGIRNGDWLAIILTSHCAQRLWMSQLGFKDA